MKTHATAIQNPTEAPSVSQMFEQNYLKKARDSLFHLFSSIDLLDINFFPLHIFISFWRVIQFIGPSLAVPYQNFWQPHSSYSMVLSIISILFHIVPSEHRAESSVILEYVYSAIILTTIIIVSFATYRFYKTSSIHKFIPAFVVGFIHGILHIFQPIAVEYIGESIGRLISSTYHFSRSNEIAAIVISLFFAVIYFLFLYYYGTPSFVFRPYSLMTIFRMPQFLFSLLTSVITLLTAIASQVSFVPRITLTFVSAFLYLTAIYIVFMPGSFISPLYKNMILSASATSFISLIVVAIYDIVGRNAVILEFFVYIFLYLIFYFVSSFVIRKYLMTLITLLDKNGEDAEKYKSFYQYVQCATLSIILSHPSSANWAIFKSGTERWPDSFLLLTLFAKFVAIYTAERKLLMLINQQIQSKNFTSYTSKQIFTQSIIILTQRQSNLTNELKSKLQVTSRQTQFVKRKIRHVWDLAIQSNIFEMDSSINNAYDSMNKAKASFNHLFCLYPNNRFVARAYARFILDVEGDTQLYKEWLSKINSLQRGILVNPDRTNLLGVHAFPSLPITVQDSLYKSNSDSELFETAMLIANASSDFEDMANAEINEQTSVIKDRINDLHIPAINCITIWTSFLFFALILIPAIAFIIYEDYFLHGLTYPLEYLYQLSFLRSAAFHLSMLSCHFVFEHVNCSEFSCHAAEVNHSHFEEDDIDTFFDVPNFDESKMKSYGGARNTLEQLRYITYLSSESIERISAYRTWMKNDSRIQYIHNLVFENSVPYIFYSPDGTTVTYNVSLQAAMMDINMRTSNLISIEPINETLVNSSCFINPTTNADPIAHHISTAMILMNDYLAQNHENIENLILFCMLFLCIIYLVTIIGILIFQIENLKSAKLEVFQCLTSLPKNEVSMVAEKLSILTKESQGGTNKYNEEEEEEETPDFNKQEENIIKVFSSASDISSTKSTENATYIVLNLILAVFTIAIIVLICQAFPNFTNNLRSHAPHLDYVLGSISYQFGVMNFIELIIVLNNNIEIPLQNIPDNIERIFLHINNFLENYQIVSYGFTPTTENISYAYDLNTSPLNSFISRLQKASKYFGCDNETKSPSDFNDYYNCLSIDMQASIVEPFIYKLIYPVVKNSTISPHNPFFSSLWEITIKLYDHLYFPTFDEILDHIMDILNETIPILRALAIVFLILSLFVVIAIYIQADNSNKRIKFALSLLLQCPIDAVMQTSKVMDILSGDFGSKTQESHIRQREFFDSIVQSIPDSVIIINSGNYEIISMNRSTERIYGIKMDDMIGKNGKEFFTSSKFSKNAGDIFNGDVQSLHTQYCKSDNDYSYLRLNHIITKMHIVITSTDQTNIYSYNKLISDEKEKSDKLLESILPSNLSKRVQKGDKDISFSVQSATILFLDIVEFTPWCAANTASMIMSTLNIMFRELDAQLARHSTMTKIKCIGDCFMCAGGIFVEVNQPALHAKETVEFGLEAIHTIRCINKEYNLSLRIRVGINTGGPLVAGVIGTDKPTFEILGPPINMAQQMEHHGVPMQVHISRSVYQLIYGGPFNIKERGKIEIKNGMVSTYLVIPKDQ